MVVMAADGIILRRGSPPPPQNKRRLLSIICFLLLMRCAQGVRYARAERHKVTRRARSISKRQKKRPHRVDNDAELFSQYHRLIEACGVSARALLLLLLREETGRERQAVFIPPQASSWSRGESLHVLGVALLVVSRRMRGSIRYPNLPTPLSLRAAAHHHAKTPAPPPPSIPHPTHRTAFKSVLQPTQPSQNNQTNKVRNLVGDCE